MKKTEYLINFLLIKKYGRGHPLKDGFLQSRKLRLTFIEILLAHLYTRVQVRSFGYTS